LKEQRETDRFEAAVLPHLDSAFNLARWLVRDPHDAEDAVQEAYLRAFKFFASFRGGDARAWLLAIVRNTCHTWMQQQRQLSSMTAADVDLDALADDAPSPEASILRRADDEAVRRAIEDLPAEFREVVVLRELEGLSYKEIAEISDVPIGTVMSRLSRARQRLEQALSTPMRKEA
jgi:RNA polymerase sigma-70 factor, ECF subfamily